MEAVCWNCGRSVSGHFCANCKALLPPEPEYFAFLEMPRQLAIDSKDLEGRFYALSRRLHPDLFARRSEREREYSLENTAVLNDAYRTLKDPITRAYYVLQLEGLETAEPGSKEVPPELLEEVFELNMALEEMKSGEEDARMQIQQARGRFEEMRADIDLELRSDFERWDGERNTETLSHIRSLLNRRKYITNLIVRTESA